MQWSQDCAISSIISYMDIFSYCRTIHLSFRRGNHGCPGGSQCRPVQIVRLNLNTYCSTTGVYARYCTLYIASRALWGSSVDFFYYIWLIRTPAQVLAVTVLSLLNTFFPTSVLFVM